MKHIPLISFLTLLLFSPTAFAGDPFFRSERIFEPSAERPANHSSSIVVLNDGTLAATWFGGSKEGLPDVGIWLSRRPAGSDEWTPPVEIIDDPEYAEGNSVLYEDRDGLLHIFYLVKYEERWDAWESSRIFERTSGDGGASWSAPRLLSDDMGIAIHHNIVELTDGKLLLPVYEEIPPQCAAWISADGFTTWEEHRVPLTEPGSSQPDVVLLDDGSLVMFARHHGFPGRIWMTVSGDGGATWREPKKTKLKNPDSGLAAVSPDGKTIVLAFNDNAYVRTPLSLAFSADGGRTWSRAKPIETDSQEFSYPYLVAAPDGTIHLTYTAENRKTIKHAEFNLEWLARE